jgi:guanine nucleotide-binding protein alpha-1 subunit
MFRSSDNHDPLSAALAPPKNESAAARAARLRAEAEARRVSDEIDEQLKQDRATRRRQRPCVKVLLLGQSESGTFSRFLLLWHFIPHPFVFRKVDYAQK